MVQRRNYLKMTEQQILQSMVDYAKVSELDKDKAWMEIKDFDKIIKDPIKCRS